MSKQSVIDALVLRLEVMTLDRDAEKSMKARARMQRDEQTLKNRALLERIKELELQLEHDLDDCK